MQRVRHSRNIVKIIPHMYGPYTTVPVTLLFVGHFRQLGAEQCKQQGGESLLVRGHVKPSYSIDHADYRLLSRNKMHFMHIAANHANSCITQARKRAQWLEEGANGRRKVEDGRKKTECLRRKAEDGG